MAKIRIVAFILIKKKRKKEKDKWERKKRMLILQKHTNY